MVTNQKLKINAIQETIILPTSFTNPIEKELHFC